MPDKLKKTSKHEQIDLPIEIGGNLPVWRPIHYLGSKLRLINEIRIQINALDPAFGTVCDLFAGSGTVSMALSADRDIVAADIQEYSRVLCAAILKPACLDDATVTQLFSNIERYEAQLEIEIEPILEFEQKAIEQASTRPDLLCAVVESGSMLSNRSESDLIGTALDRTIARVKDKTKQLLVTRYYGGVYFSFRQALFLDCALHAIQDLPATDREAYLAAVLSSASSLVNSVGKQFAQPIKPRRKDGTIKKHLISQMVRDRLLDPRKIFAYWLEKYRTLEKRGSHEVICADYRDVLRRLTNVSVVYADPPYTRDHYSRFYHVLETLSRRDSPSVSTTLLTGEGGISRGLYRGDRHQSPFSIKSQAPTAFAELFSGVQRLGAPLLLSYSPFIKDGHPRLMTVDSVAALAEKYFRNVRVVPVGGLTHSKLNRTDLHLNASFNAEVFVICRD